MALRAAATGFLRPAAVPMCEGYTCLVPMLSAGSADDIYNTFRFGACSATQELEDPPCPFNFGETLREAGTKLSESAFIPVDHLPKLRPEDIYHILGGGAVVAGLVMMSEGEKNDDKDGQTSEIIHDLKEKLSEVTERAENLAAENKRLLEDVDKVREANKQHGYEVWMDTIRSIHEKELARLEAGSDKEGDGSGNDNKGNKSGKKDNECDKKGNESDKKGGKSDKKDEKPLAKKLLELLMAPSTVETWYKDITSNWAKWSYLFGMVPVFYALKMADYAKILKGDLSGIDPRVEVVESRACPCGIPWPQRCSRCGGGLPNFVGDSGLVSFPGIPGVKGETFTATTPTPVPRATSPRPPQP